MRTGNELVRLKLASWILIFLTLSFLAISTPLLISSWLNNQGALLLRQAWVTGNASPQITIPECPQPQASEQGRAELHSLLQSALQFAPQNQRAWFNIGRVAWLEGDCQSAGMAWQKALLLNPNDRLAEWELNNALYTTGDRQSAIGFYRRIGAAGYYYHRAKRAREANYLDSAIAGYELAAAITPSRSITQIISDLYGETGRPQAALIAWQKLLPFTVPDSADYWWVTGQIADGNGQRDVALAAYQKALNLETESYFRYLIYMRIGAIYQERREYTQAQYYFEQAMLTNPQNIWPFLNLGIIAKQQNRYAEALSWFRRAGEINPTSEWPTYYQATLLWDMGNRFEAQQLLERAEQQNPQNPWVKYYLGLAAYESQDLFAAIAYMQQAIRRYPAPPTSWQMLLGDWQLELGQCPQAIATYQQISQQQPNNSHIQQKLTKAKQSCPSTSP